MTCRRLLILCMASLIVAGCASPAPPLPKPRPVLMKRTPGDYTVEAMILDVSKFSQKLLYSNTDRNMDQVLRTEDTDASIFPKVYLKPGQSKTVDTSETHRFPTTFDPEGNAAEHGTQPIGQRAKLGLRFDKHKYPIVDFSLEDNVPLLMQELKGPKKQVYFIPVVNTKSVTSLVRTKPNTWTIVSGGSTIIDRKERSGKNAYETRSIRVWRVTLVRVTPPIETTPKKP